MSSPVAERHPLCVQLQSLLDAIIEEQDTGTSSFGYAFSQEFGVPLTSGLMQAAHVRRRRLDLLAGRKAPEREHSDQHCSVCATRLDVPGDPGTLACRDVCLRCLTEAGDVPAIAAAIGHAKKGTGAP